MTIRIAPEGVPTIKLPLEAIRSRLDSPEDSRIAWSGILIRNDRAYSTDGRVLMEYHLPEGTVNGDAWHHATGTDCKTAAKLPKQFEHAEVWARTPDRAPVHDTMFSDVLQDRETKAQIAYGVQYLERIIKAAKALGASTLCFDLAEQAMAYPTRIRFLDADRKELPHRAGIMPVSD